MGWRHSREATLPVEKSTSAGGSFAIAVKTGRTGYLPLPQSRRLMQRRISISAWVKP